MIALLDALGEARLLLQRGWTQEAYCRLPDGSLIPPHSKMHGQAERRIAYCLAGALDQAAARHLLDPDELRALVEEEIAEPRRSPEDPFTIERWNDAPGRTQADVLALLDGVLARVYASVIGVMIATGV